MSRHDILTEGNKKGSQEAEKTRPRSEGRRQSVVVSITSVQSLEVKMPRLPFSDCDGEKYLRLGVELGGHNFESGVSHRH